MKNKYWYTVERDKDSLSIFVYDVRQNYEWELDPVVRYFVDQFHVTMSGNELNTNYADAVKFAELLSGSILAFEES